MSLEDIFNFALSYQKRKGKISRLMRPTSLEAEITFSPTNYTRLLSGPDNLQFEGKEFIISNKELKASTFGPIKTGDRLIDPELGTMTIRQVDEMYNLGGGIIGFRVKVD